MKDMDKIFRAKLYNHESTLPEDLWNKIEPRIQKKKRRGFIWFLLGGVSLIGLIGGTYVINSQYLAGPKEFVSTDESNVISDLNLPSKTESIIDFPDEDDVSISEKQPLDKQDIPFTLTDNLKKKIEGKYLDHPKIKATPIITNVVAENNNDQLLNREKIELPTLKIEYPSLINSKAKNFKDPIGCPSFSNRNKANLFIETYYQPLFAYSVITSNSAEIGQDYINLRKETEQNLYSWSAGVNVGWISDYNVGVKAGLEYEEINGRFIYEDPEAIRNQTVITIDTLFNPDGSVTINSDTSIVQVSGIEVQRIHNYHRTLSIPIHAIYQMNFENLGVELSGGPIFNVYYRNRGKIVDPSNNDQWFTNGESGSYKVFKDRLSVGFSLTVSALYSINENIQLFARPSIKYIPETMSVSTSPFNQTYLNTGIALGARYYFSGNPNY